MILVAHIAGAAIGLLSGMIALFTRKGGDFHRRAGRVFVYSMLLMCAAAVVLATFKVQPINLVAGNNPFTIGGTLTVNPMQAPGVYTGTVAVEVQYN